MREGDGGGGEVKFYISVNNLILYKIKYII